MGHDGIVPEMIKNMAVQGAKILLEGCKKSWMFVKVPEDWLVSVIGTLYKGRYTRLPKLQRYIPTCIFHINEESQGI